jgi:hypothetical protein
MRTGWDDDQDVWGFDTVRLLAIRPRANTWFPSTQPSWRTSENWIGNGGAGGACKEAMCVRHRV